ncbi:hypothetical protein [Xenorhabdus szentirmaii]|uniref:hypothetical protein n=1 Tax=Xenorhabdus szentirmaii TaxID=290112 RepID=UPI002B407980|nr:MULTISPECIES: hypothetical protein [unclassified Xenorhabdus]
MESAKHGLDDLTKLNASFFDYFNQITASKAFGAALNSENQQQSGYLEVFSKSLRGLGKQIEIWGSFIANNTSKVNQDDAILFALSTSEHYLRYFYIAQKIANLLWQHNLVHRGKESEGYPGHFSCRVRLRNKKLETFWVCNEFKPKKEF